jgi:MinD superfamily P-loop ATPase
MKEIVLISGKGGTGKTSITASLAKISGNRTVIADCDVDASNLHLLLNPDYSQSEDFFSGYLAFIDKNKCTMCNKCKDVCRFKAIDNYSINELRCEGCGYCEIVCPENAIELKKAYRGKIYISGTRIDKVLVHAEMEIGAQNSGKLVASIKSAAKKIAVDNNAEYILIDGSPGIGCPVIASLTGADLAIIVTEPSVSGKNDMIRIHKLINKMPVKAAVIVNKSDINKKINAEIRSYSADNNIAVLEDIPFSNLFHEALAEKKTVVELKENAIASKINNSWIKINNLLNK